MPKIIKFKKGEIEYDFAPLPEMTEKEISELNKDAVKSEKTNNGNAFGKSDNSNSTNAS